jgi:thioesterase-3
VIPKPCFEIRIRGFHTDLYGHVNNARYLEFLEAGRWQLFEESEDFERLVNGKENFVVVAIAINYRKALVLNDLAQVHTRLKEVGERSAVLYQEVREAKSGAVCADAEVTFVISDGEKALHLVGDRRALLNRLPMNFSE